ncbi:uncharacterized protein TRIADDRAFT_56779 [Trichoplax adhaerens]|uniref:Protein kinase domain-containing protein n=1 Tax=Trichoplax adhaerens TaxID=10228 RepID=B3RWK2_TRIAD|nr:hypothetical protein TRIADDRAFT_56779 [Trichoplax adhaerens]EDV25151.1 hypothetical protein TRIADDRAFT_56779 [Trichoplax adhaerens]|eukprot:XP_002113041.1 hypothetical protein TRIADDRAFT_56779 [Trichoplax adhaerens]
MSLNPINKSVFDGLDEPKSESGCTYCCWTCNEDKDETIRLLSGGEDFFGRRRGLTRYDVKDEELPPKDVVSDTLKKSLGAGYFGTIHDLPYDEDHYIFKSWDLNVIPFDHESNKDEIKQSVDKLKSFHFDHLVEIFAYYRDFEFHGVLEEYCSSSLYKRIKSRDDQILTCLQRFSILNEILDGLHYLHSNKIVHNNLTSRNVLLNGSSYITTKLSHGGYYSLLPYVNKGMKDCDEDTLAKQGKLGYISTQAFDGKVISSNDVYSFGAILIVMISGDEPYLPDDDPQYTRDLLSDHQQWNNWRLKDSKIKWAKRKFTVTKRTFRRDLLSLANYCLHDDDLERPSLDWVYTYIPIKNILEQ